MKDGEKVIIRSEVPDPLDTANSVGAGWAAKTRYPPYQKC